MAKMIITQSQLKAINETVTAVATTNSPVNATSALNSLPNSNVDAKKVRFDSNAGGADFEITNPTELAKVPSDAGSVSMATNNKNTGSTLAESRYTKRQIELARLLEMRKNGKVYSKKQLNEMFMETQENAERLRDGIGDCDIFQVIDAVDEFFPEESENFKEALHNGADLAEYLCSIFSNGKVDANKEEEFLDSLGL